MRTGRNVVLQLATLVCVVLLRCTAPGWLLIIAIVTLIVPAMLVAPTVLSLVVRRRRVLPRAVAAPFVACAATVLLAALTLPDFDDVREHAPLLVLVGADGSDVPAALGGIGALAVLAHLVSLVWLVVAVVNGRPAAARA